ncbi:MAG: glycosyltransferase family 2 protein [Candidatus Omnitrophica bacterium]|nr:glycosyltransferase family 2 protein [Candidatus Omnitrophota bacterium]
MKACVLIPTFNEAGAIGSLIEKILRHDLSVIVVDDGSRDNTSVIAREKGAVVLRNPANEGKGASLKKGFNFALEQNYDAVITMDGDGQHRPDDIPYFMRLAQYSQSGIFIGNRMSRSANMPLLRLLTNKFMSWLISAIAKQRIPDTQCGFRLIKKEVLERLKLRTSKYETESEILIKAARAGFKVESVPIKSVYSGEKSKINPFVDTLRFVRFIIKEL